MSKIYKLKLDINFVNIDYSVMSPTEIVLGIKKINLVATVDNEFIEKLIEFIEKECKTKNIRLNKCR